MKKRDAELSAMWARHTAEWRDPAQVCSQWRDASALDARLLESKATGAWWSTLERLGITVVVTREYEHLVMAASARDGRPRLSFLALPHPSGLAVDRARNRIFLGSTRNPNQVYLLKPAKSLLERKDMAVRPWPGSPLTTVSSTFFPGSLYMHDLAWIGSELYANAVGHNAVVRLNAEGSFERVWWPRCIEQDGAPVFSHNHIQLNSIAAGGSLEDCYFSASSAAIGRLRPGHLSYPVDGRGVIFSGRTREPVCTGLTRPHSARLSGGRIWVANSGYGEVGFVADGRFEVVARLPGWTRGLAIVGDVFLAATSRVIPRYARYAPGLDLAESRCALHAVSLTSGKVLGSLTWPNGNQVFAVDWIDHNVSSGFLFEARTRKRTREVAFFYSYLTD
jgi:uncharacterized protein (TIGR03032 family)